MFLDPCLAYWLRLGPTMATSWISRSLELLPKRLGDALDAASLRLLCIKECIGDFPRWLFVGPTPFLEVAVLPGSFSTILLWHSWASNLWTRNPFCLSIFTVLWSLLCSCLPTRLLVCVRASLMNLVPATTTFSISLMLLICCSSYYFSTLCIGLVELRPMLTDILALLGICLSVEWNNVSTSAPFFAFSPCWPPTFTIESTECNDICSWPSVSTIVSGASGSLRSLTGVFAPLCFDVVKLRLYIVALFTGLISECFP